MGFGGGEEAHTFYSIQSMAAVIPPREQDQEGGSLSHEDRQEEGKGSVEAVAYWMGIRKVY
jgi:hypothetical protein